jgi:hypothetical protein
MVAGSNPALCSVTRAEAVSWRVILSGYLSKIAGQSPIYVYIVIIYAFCYKVVCYNYIHVIYASPSRFLSPRRLLSLYASLDLFPRPSHTPHPSPIISHPSISHSSQFHLTTLFFTTHTPPTPPSPSHRPPLFLSFYHIYMYKCNKCYIYSTYI